MKENRKYWICRMCGKAYYEVLPPNPCPECKSPASSMEQITEKEFKEIE